MKLTCGNNLALERGHTPPSVKEWLLQFGKDRKVCGAPASYLGPAQMPLCDGCADLIRLALADPHTLGNVILGRARTEDEVRLLVRPIQ